MDPAAARCLWLTTLRADGSPHTTPVWFVLEGAPPAGTVWMASSTVNVKVQNLLRDPRVSMAFEGTASRPYVAQGRVRVHHSFVRHAHLVAAFAARYGGWDATDPAQNGPRVLLEAPVERWLMQG